jgi:hypothetical protein
VSPKRISRFGLSVGPSEDPRLGFAGLRAFETAIRSEDAADFGACLGLAAGLGVDSSSNRLVFGLVATGAMTRSSSRREEVRFLSEDIEESLGVVVMMSRDSKKFPLARI